MAIINLIKAVLSLVVGIALLGVVAACHSSSDLPNLNVPGVSLVYAPTSGQIVDAAWSADSKSMLMVNRDEGPTNGPQGDIHLLDVKDSKATHLIESVKLFNLSNPYLSANGSTALFAAESSPHGYGIHELNLQTSELKLRFNAYYEAWSNSQNVVALLNASECGAALPRSSWICILNTDTGEHKTIFLTNQSFSFGDMDWSPDDKQLAVSYHEAANNSTSPDRQRIYLYSLQSDRFTPITPDSMDAHDPAWSPDGKYLAYIQTELKSTEAQLMVMRADGSCGVPLIPVKGLIDSPAWSPDGNWLSFVYNFRLYKVDLNDETIKQTLAKCQ